MLKMYISQLLLLVVTNRDDLKKHFCNSAGRETSQYFFDPYSLTPVKIKYSLNLSGVVLNTYICAKIEKLLD